MDTEGKHLDLVRLSEEIHLSWDVIFSGPPDFDPSDWLDGESLVKILGKRYDDIAESIELKSRIRARFPEPAPWEDPEAIPQPETLEIVVMTHASAGTPHLDPLRASHPGCTVHVLVNPDSDGEAKVDAWRNNDRRIREWWRTNRQNVTSGFVAFVEWDVLARADLRDLIEPETGLLGRDLKEPGDDWAWWGEIARLPAALSVHACGIAPLAVLILRRDCLDAIAAPEWDEAFAADVFCEVRLPTIARACGFTLTGTRDLPGVGVHAIPHPGTLPGIWHPVKHPLL